MTGPIRMSSLRVQLTGLAREQRSTDRRVIGYNRITDAIRSLIQLHTAHYGYSLCWYYNVRLVYMYI